VVNRNFAVGLFVAAALAAFVGGTIWLTGKKGSEPTAGYSIFFDKDVSGLMPGGPVYYLGVDVGTLTTMKIIPGDTMRVRVDIKVLKSVPIDKGTYASIAFQGITGVAVIKLAADPGQHAPLEKGGGAPYPVIEARDIGLTALLENAPLIIDRLDSVLVDINKFLSDENQAHIASMLGDLATFSHALAEEKDFIRELPPKLMQSVEELNQTLARINSMAEKLDPGLDSAIANLESTMANLAQTTARMEAWTAANDDAMNAFMGDGLGQFPALVAEAHETIEEARKLIKELRENPSKLLYERREESVELEH
jgi:phospholipid/cholesterol/gamma-HCH transport system substrate-binding protein